MTDRDRLAADLADIQGFWKHKNGWAQMGMAPTPDEQADRLIAAGWTRRDPVAEMEAAEIDRLVREATRPVTVSDLRPPPYIDEEGLARALHAAFREVGWYELTNKDASLACTIAAKAYREDTDAHD